MDKKKIGAGFAGALQKAADAAKLAKLTVQDMTADAKQSRGKKAQQKADAQKVPASKDEPTAVEPPENAAHCDPKRPSDHLLSDGGGWGGFP